MHYLIYNGKKAFFLIMPRRGCLMGWSLLFVGFFPYILTKIICFGPKGDKTFKGGIVGVIGIWLYWVIFFGTLTSILYAASKPTPTLEDITFSDKYAMFIKMTVGNHDYLSLSSTTEGSTMYMPYYTTKDDIDKDLLSKIITKNFFIYERYQLEGFEINNSGISEDSWYISLNGEYLGSVFVKPDLFLTEIVYHWDMEKLNKRDDPTFLQRLPELTFD